jgi:hypothetical protein
VTTKTETSTATIQSVTHTFKASGPYEGSADATNVPTIPFAPVRPVATASGALVPSLPKARGGSRLGEAPDSLKMPGFAVGAAVGRPSFDGNFFLTGERVRISFYRLLASR